MAFLKKLRSKFSRNKKETAETKVAEEKFPTEAVEAEKNADPQLSPVTEDRDGDEAESHMDTSTAADKTKGSVTGSESSVGENAADEAREVPESSNTAKSDWDCCGVSFTIP